MHISARLARRRSGCRTAQSRSGRGRPYCGYQHGGVFEDRRQARAAESRSGILRARQRQDSRVLQAHGIGSKRLPAYSTIPDEQNDGANSTEERHEASEARAAVGIPQNTGAFFYDNVQRYEVNEAFCVSTRRLVLACSNERVPVCRLIGGRCVAHGYFVTFFVVRRRLWQAMKGPYTMKQTTFLILFLLMIQ